jgi:hypothetical protein
MEAFEEAVMDRRSALVAIALATVLMSTACDRLGLGRAAGPPADKVVGEFLEAMRIGNDDKAMEFLTPLARSKTAELEMVLAPSGSDTATFKIIRCELVGEQAQVTADWTDLDDGRPHTDRVIWILRRETPGWRISGMATQVFADQQPIVLNFEDPADMLRKQQQAEEELARRERRDGIQLTNPNADSTPTVR